MPHHKARTGRAVRAQTEPLKPIADRRGCARWLPFRLHQTRRLRTESVDEQTEHWPPTAWRGAQRCASRSIMRASPAQLQAKHARQTDGSTHLRPVLEADVGVAPAAARLFHKPEDLVPRRGLVRLGFITRLNSRAPPSVINCACLALHLQGMASTKEAGYSKP
jgi:hypothetical protein